MSLERGDFGNRFDLEDEEERQEKAFYDLIETVEESTRKTRGFQEILKEVEEETGDYIDATKKMTAFLKKREETLDHIIVHWNNPEEKYLQEDISWIMKEMRMAIGTPENFLGNGAVAEVYTYPMPGSNEQVCIKWIKDYERYAEGAHIAREADFLKRLRHLNVEGVRVPKPLAVFSSLRMEGILMEKLDAFNFRRILENQTTEGIKDELPEGFDVNVYFGKVSKFLKEMHRMGIYHGDLHLRNLMIDRHTGDPYVIDFGKGRLDYEQDKTSANQTDYAANDRETLRLARLEVLEWLKNKQE